MERKLLLLEGKSKGHSLATKEILLIQSWFCKTIIVKKNKNQILGCFVLGKHDGEIWSILKGWLHHQAVPAVPAAPCPPPGSLGCAGAEWVSLWGSCCPGVPWEGFVCTPAPSWEHVRALGHRCSGLGCFPEQAQCLHLSSQLHFEMVKVICGVVRSASNTPVELFPSLCYLKWPLTYQFTVIHRLGKNNLFFASKTNFSFRLIFTSQ